MKKRVFLDNQKSEDGKHADYKINSSMHVVISSAPLTDLKQLDPSTPRSYATDLSQPFEYCISGYKPTTSAGSPPLLPFKKDVEMVLLPQPGMFGPKLAPANSTWRTKPFSRISSFSTSTSFFNGNRKISPSALLQ
jgi:hypothetical protein